MMSNHNYIGYDLQDHGITFWGPFFDLTVFYLILIFFNLNLWREKYGFSLLDDQKNDSQVLNFFKEYF